MFRFYIIFPSSIPSSPFACRLAADVSPLGGYEECSYWAGLVTDLHGTFETVRQSWKILPKIQRPDAPKHIFRRFGRDVRAACICVYETKSPRWQCKKTFTAIVLRRVVYWWKNDRFIRGHNVTYTMVNNKRFNEIPKQLYALNVYGK